MIQTYTRLTVADNSGAKIIRLINIPGSGKRKFASLGDVVVCNVREAAPNSPVRKGDVVRAVVIRQAQGHRRPDGTYIKFDDNAAVLIGDNLLPRGPVYSGRWRGSCETGVSCASCPWRRRWSNAYPHRRHGAGNRRQGKRQDRPGGTAVPGNDRIVIEGVNIVTRHMKGRPGVRQSGRIQKEAPVHASNVVLICNKCNRPTKPRTSFLDTGRRVRSAPSVRK